jgi:hypothetical protein
MRLKPFCFILTATTAIVLFQAGSIALHGAALTSVALTGHKWDRLFRRKWYSTKLWRLERVPPSSRRIFQQQFGKYLLLGP